MDEEKYKVYAIDQNRTCDFLPFLCSKEAERERPAILRMVEELKRTGRGKGNRWQTLRAVSGKPSIHYMKLGTSRIPFILHQTQAGIYVILNAFLKKGQSWPPGAVDRAVRDRDLVPDLPLEFCV